MTAADVKIVGKVYGRASAVTFVDNGDGTQTRVRWRRRGGGGAPGYVCDEHGHLSKPNQCPHALAASVALRWQRKAERDGETS